MIGKTCATCNVKKPRSEFHKAPDNADGLKSDCKACKEKKRKAYKAANYEHVRALERVVEERYRNNKDKAF